MIVGRGFDTPHAEFLCHRREIVINSHVIPHRAVTGISSFQPIRKRGFATMEEYQEPGIIVASHV